MRHSETRALVTKCHPAGFVEERGIAPRLCSPRPIAPRTCRQSGVAMSDSAAPGMRRRSNSHVSFESRGETAGLEHGLPHGFKGQQRWKVEQRNYPARVTSTHERKTRCSYEGRRTYQLAMRRSAAQPQLSRLTTPRAGSVASPRLGPAYWHRISARVPWTSHRTGKSGTPTTYRGSAQEQQPPVIPVTTPRNR
jgi:hypothetical protein